MQEQWKPVRGFEGAYEVYPVKETTSEGETSEDRLKRHKEKSSA